MTMWALVLKHWKILTFAGAALTLVGIGWGAWWFLDKQVDARYEAEARAEAAEKEIADLKETAIREANRLSAVKDRLDAEMMLTEKRLTDAQTRIAEANARARKSQGMVNDLRSRLESQPDCNCGIGTDLTERLRLDRDERLAGREPGN